MVTVASCVSCVALATLTLSAFTLAGAGVGRPAAALPREESPAATFPPPAPEAIPDCDVDLKVPGVMRDILSNALTRGFKVPSQRVQAFLNTETGRHASGDLLLRAAATHFELPEADLIAKVEKYKHSNCGHPVPSALHPILLIDPQPHPDCDQDFELAGMMSDAISNALMRGLGVPEREVREFLDGAGDRYEDGPAVFKASAARFRLTEEVLATEVNKFKHTNCEHEGGGRARAGARNPLPDDGLPVPSFAKDVTLHVVLHELGHALIREFDIPVLGNEETVADAFATYYITTYLPDRALEVLLARTRSLMIEAEEDFRGKNASQIRWGGEHDHDARRANQIAALAIAADPVKFAPLREVVGMSERDTARAVDYGGELRRSWRRVLAPLWMPEGTVSGESRVQFDPDNPFLSRLCTDSLAAEIGGALGRFDWHSQVTVRFVDAEGGAGWNRSSRTITVNSGYVRRFIGQAASVK